MWNVSHLLYIHQRLASWLIDTFWMRVRFQYHPSAFILLNCCCRSTCILFPQIHFCLHLLVQACAEQNNKDHAEEQAYRLMASPAEHICFTPPFLTAIRKSKKGVILALSWEWPTQKNEKTIRTPQHQNNSNKLFLAFLTYSYLST
jgi:hypothetical protein